MPRRTDKPLGPTCAKCGSQQEPRVIHVVLGSCWNCHSPMKIAFGAIGGVALSPPLFTVAELTAARNAGAKLVVRHSRTVSSDYMANVCPGCDQITGDHYLHDFWDLESAETEVSRELGCVSCAQDEADPPSAQ